ncbi:MAG: radical SAM family heme chaperone HemW [Muribaculaceae bacterium]|nr:radical SAM family heme chaperone HemW [Muribaculaceae bacterium]
MAGLYVHIPFCRSKCAYCDFYSTPDVSRMNSYVDALLTELPLRMQEIDEPFTTLYLGGGTPSMLPVDLLTRMLEGIAEHIDLHRLEEVTIEANPEDIDSSTIRLFESSGINRISIGSQSFHDEELAAVSRKHSASDALTALDALSASGVNFNADLIYGLPGQSLGACEDNIERLLEYAPPHFAAYLLSYEPGTRLYAKLLKVEVAEASESMAHDMYAMLCEKASGAGYEHYEISNFALPGKKAVHNSLYWHYVPYIGIGAAAHSFDGKTRRINPGNVKLYIEKLRSGIKACCEEEETIIDRFNDYVITSLRTNDGFDASFASSCFNNSLVNQFIANIRRMPPDALTKTPDGNYVIPEQKWLTADAVLRELILDQ